MRLLKKLSLVLLVSAGFALLSVPEIGLARTPDADYSYVDIGDDLNNLYVVYDSEEETQAIAIWLSTNIPGFGNIPLAAIGANCSGSQCDEYYIPYSDGSYYRLDYIISHMAQDEQSSHDGIIRITTGDSMGHYQPDATTDIREPVSISISGSVDNPEYTSDDPEYFLNQRDFGRTGDTEQEAGSGSGPQCENDGGFTGFIFCDVFVRVLSWVEQVQSWIVTVLFEQDPLVIGDTDDGLYTVWTNFRNLANGLLVVAFMFVIFSLAMSVNVDAYTIKKMVPRLLVAAIAIQASYFISALMVDFTNLLGAGLRGLTDMAMDEIVLQPGVGEAIGGTITVGAIAGGAIAAGVIFGFAALMPLFLLFLLVALGAFLIVALRELFIIMAIVLSPIAFLANLLPNTERWFKFWWSNFARLLFMYPFIILMIQLGNLGAYMMLSTGRFSGATAMGGVLTVVMALLMQLAATLSIYFAFKVGGSLLSITTGGMSKLRKFGGGGGGKGPGGRKRGPVGKLGAIASQRRGELQAGARGNRVTRAIAAPKSRMTTNSRALATSNLEQQTAAASKDLEEKNLSGDANTLNEFATYGNSRQSLSGRIKQLSESGDEKDRDKAEKLKQFVPYANKRSYQAAALKAAAASPFVEGTMDKGFQNVGEIFKGNPEYAEKLQLDAAVAANKAGRKDIWSKHGPAKASDTAQTLGTKDFLEMNDKSFDPNNSPEFVRSVRDLASRDTPTRTAIRTAMSPHSGMSAAKHQALKRAFMNDAESAEYRKYEAEIKEAKRTGNKDAEATAKQKRDSVGSALYNKLYDEASSMPPPNSSQQQASQQPSPTQQTGGSNANYSPGPDDTTT